MNGSGEELFLGEHYSDAEWSMLLELAEKLGIGAQVTRESPHANRDLILDKLGYTASWGIENGLMGLLQAWFTSCRRCGATIALRHAEEGHLGPLDQHTYWHATIEGVLPNGQKVDR